MVGSNFDPQLPFAFKALNDQYKGIRVEEVYGSIKDFKIFGSARPDFRLPNFDIKDFEKRIRDYNLCGISVNYTENTPIVDKAKINTVEVKEKLRQLVNMGVSRITLAHPLSMELTYQLSNMPIEISTIYAVNSDYQLRELKRRCPTINKVCLDVDVNRDFRSIFHLNKVGKELGIECELLANEFCLYNCVDRVQCYNDHTQISTETEASQFKRYPMGRCINSRLDPVEWLRARFILPQSMKWYQQSVQIDRFKITGRTHPTKYILWIVEEYMKQNYNDNLLQLWADVKNIKRVSKGEEDFLMPTFDINSAPFGDEFLWKYWMDDKLDKDREYETKFLKTFLEPQQLKLSL